MVNTALPSPRSREASVAFPTASAKLTAGLNPVVDGGLLLFVVLVAKAWPSLLGPRGL